MTWTQTTLNVKDASGTDRPIIAYTDGTNFSFAHPLLDNTGAIISPAQASAVANTAGGCSTYCATGLGGGNALFTSVPATVKAAPGNLYGIDFYNPNAAACFIQIFDALIGSVTLGTTVPKLVKWVPANGAWEEKFTGEAKITFSTGMAIAATTTPVGGGAPTAGLYGNIVYL